MTEPLVDAPVPGLTRARDGLARDLFGIPTSESYHQLYDILSSDRLTLEDTVR